MTWTPKTEYTFSPDDEKKVFNLILKNTIEKEIRWSIGSAMHTGLMGNDKILLYRGETKTAISIQNKKEYAYMEINKEQEELLKKVISGKTILEIENPENVASNIWSGKTFYEPPKSQDKPSTNLDKPKKKLCKLK